jgi:hypothetical protein
MFGWDRFRFDKKRAGTRYIEHVFLHPVVSVGHVVHSGVSVGRYVDARFFLLGWDRVRIQQKFNRDTLRRTSVSASGGICGSHRAFRSVQGVKHRHTIFHAWVGPVQIQQKARWDTLRRTCVFASGGICRSRSANLCVRGMKHRCTIFHARGGTGIVKGVRPSGSWT